MKVICYWSNLDYKVLAMTFLVCSSFLWFLCFVSDVVSLSPWAHGRVAVRDEFPYVMGLLHKPTRLVVCTAALVTPKKAMMSGRCFRDPENFERDIFKTKSRYTPYAMIGSNVNLNASKGGFFPENPIVRHWYHCHFRYPNNLTMAFHDTGMVLMKYKQDGAQLMKIPAGTTEDVKKAWNRLRTKGQTCKMAGWPNGKQSRVDAHRVHVVYANPMSLKECKEKIKDPVLHRLGYVCAKMLKPETGVCPTDMIGAILECGKILFGFRTRGLTAVCEHSLFILVGDSVKPLALEANIKVKGFSHKFQPDIKFCVLLVLLSKINF